MPFFVLSTLLSSRSTPHFFISTNAFPFCHFESDQEISPPCHFERSREISGLNARSLHSAIASVEMTNMDVISSTEKFLLLVISSAVEKSRFLHCFFTFNFQLNKHKYLHCNTTLQIFLYFKNFFQKRYWLSVIKGVYCASRMTNSHKWPLVAR